MPCAVVHTESKHLVIFPRLATKNKYLGRGRRAERKPSEGSKSGDLGGSAAGSQRQRRSRDAGGYAKKDHAREVSERGARASSLRVYYSDQSELNFVSGWVGWVLPFSSGGSPFGKVSSSIHGVYQLQRRLLRSTRSKHGICKMIAVMFVNSHCRNPFCVSFFLFSWLTCTLLPCCCCYCCDAVHSSESWFRLLWCGVQWPSSRCPYFHGRGQVHVIHVDRNDIGVLSAV